MEPILEAKKLNLWYGPNHALHDVSIAIPEHEITAFIGPSGCGKSTFLRTLNRMNDLIPGVKLSGEVDFHGQDLYGSSVDPTWLRKQIGMVFQKANPFPMSIYDNVAYGPRTHGIRNRVKLDEIVENSLRSAAIWDEVKDRLKKSALGLSGGQQQRLCIARALAVEPEVLLMDESTSALDPISTSKIEDLAAELALARKDEGELQDRFCRVMRFGTSGLRGKMGVGTNRINSIILSKATRAISRYLTERYESPAMVIGYDTRHNSREYADGIAQEFARSGIRCYLFAEPTPVPVVSFAIRQLGLNGGVMITASHNTKEYNGYKVYDHFGNQIDDRKAALIEQYMEAEPTFWEGVPKDLTEAQKEGTISFLEEDIKEAYLAALERETLWWNEDIVHCK